MENMTPNVHELRKSPETEKITINPGYLDLGHVDLIVQDGFYSNRTDFIRTAIRSQLERRAATIASVSVLVALHASPAVTAALADRAR
jgi:Arc/MetJ-type ribon-helix-helix transcriptional regulator